VLDSIKADLKTAMRAKDKPRLTAIRAILAEVTNADKAGKPTKGDQPMYNLLQKQINSSKAAIEQCREAKREDLIAKETEQLEILQSYLEQIPVVAHEKLDSIVTSVVQKLEQDGQKVAVGPVMGKVMGLLAKKPFDTTYLKSKVEEA
ncbi:altered inheritance of mitochondria protein 41, mitochondrial, partial [Corynespora cassiicola Philippines]